MGRAGCRTPADAGCGGGARLGAADVDAAAGRAGARRRACLCRDNARADGDPRRSRQAPPIRHRPRTPTATRHADGHGDAEALPLSAYSLDEVVPLESFPRPAGDNGWGMHWIPTVKQEPAVVDRFVAELQRMHIRWVIFLNDGTQIGDNDYLVDRLVAAGMMPVMRIYRSTITPHDGDLAALVRHYRVRGVTYFQLYNEPNVNDENKQGFANPTHYAAVWAEAARTVVENGGLPGLGALSPAALTTTTPSSTAPCARWPTMATPIS